MNLSIQEDPFIEALSQCPWRYVAYAVSALPLLSLGGHVITRIWHNPGQRIWAPGEHPHRELFIALSGTIVGVGMTALATATQTHWLPVVKEFRHCIMVFGSYYLVTWIHEMGHLRTIKALFVDVDPFISISFLGLGGGNTVMNGPGQILSESGKRFSRDTAISIISAAGPAAELITGIFASVVHYQFRETSQTVADGTAIIGAVALNRIVSYSAGAFGPRQPGQQVAHDFQTIYNLSGISRIRQFAVTAFIALIPAFIVMSHLVCRLFESGPTIRLFREDAGLAHIDPFEIMRQVYLSRGK